MVGLDPVRGRPIVPRIAPNYRVMAYAKLIGPSPVSTPSSLLRSGTRSREIPDDLLREASLRLGILSLLGAVLWTVGTLAGHLAAGALAGGNHGAWASLETTDAIAVVMVIVSLSLFAYARRSKQDSTAMLGLVLRQFLLGSPGPCMLRS